VGGTGVSPVHFGVSPKCPLRGDSLLGNPKHPLELRRKLAQFRRDLGRLLRHRVKHFIPHFRAVADQFQGRHRQRQLIIDFMAHVRELFIQLPDLLRGQSRGNIRYTHAREDVANPAAKQVRLRRNQMSCQRNVSSWE